jgi:dTDP-4-dehydrorhamnose 3,5-epimerase
MKNPAGWIERPLRMTDTFEYRLSLCVAYIFRFFSFQQAKLIRVLRGRICHGRTSAATSHGEHMSVVLSAEGGEQLFLPAGFVHGFCPLVGEAKIFYKVEPCIRRHMSAGLIGLIPHSVFLGRVAGVGQPCRRRMRRSHP